MTKWAFKSSALSKDEIIFVFEHAGLYSCELAISLAKRNLHFVLVPGLEIKRLLDLCAKTSIQFNPEMQTY